MLISKSVGTLVVGKNIGWKDKINIGRRNNQNFVQIPFAKIIEILRYKCEDRGIVLVEQEESYTSKASFLDLDEIPVYGEENGVKPEFSGRRVSRGLYIAKDGRKIHADVNGAFNILRKYKGKLDSEDFWLSRGDIMPAGL